MELGLHATVEDSIGIFHRDESLGQGRTNDDTIRTAQETLGADFACLTCVNVSWARTVASGVTASASTVTAANAQTDSFAAIAAAPATSELVVQIVGIVG